MAAYELVPDEHPMIKKVLRLWADREGLDLILTNGGTGLAPRDRTPEATRELLDREVPGLAELMRLVGLRKTPMAALYRGVAGVRGRTLILNLPGSPKGARESLEAVLPVLPHALSLVTGKPWKEGHHEYGAGALGFSGGGRGQAEGPGTGRGAH